MRKYVTVSVKIPIEVKEKLQKLGIKPSMLLRRAIEKEVRKEEVKAIKKEVERLKGALDKIPIEDVIRSIREDRDAR